MANFGLGAIQAIAQGQKGRLAEQEAKEKSALSDIALQKGQIGIRALEREEGQANSSEELSKRAIEFWKGNQRQPFRATLAELSRVDNQRAVNMAKTIGGLEKSNLVESAYNLQASTLIPDNDLQTKNTLIQRAIDSIGDPNNPLVTELSRIQQAKPGEERDRLEFEGLEFAKTLGAFPDEKVGTGGKTRRQIDREIAVKEQQAETAADALALRRKEYTLREDSEVWDRSRLTPSGEKILEKIDDRVFENEKTVGTYETLAQDFDRLSEQGVRGGKVGWFREKLKDWLGSQDEVSHVIRKFRGIRASSAINNLPPGVASDKDIELALSGTPPEDAGPKYVASWLRGAAKMAKLDSIYHKERSKFLSKEKTQAEFTDHWDANRDRIMGQALGMSEEEVRGGREALESKAREAIKKDLTEAQAANIPTFTSLEEAEAANLTDVKRFRVGDEIYEVE